MQIENLVKTTVEEIRKVLTETSVMGEPRTIEGVTLIPIISTGFLFGAGGGTGKAGDPAKGGEGEGGGTGGGVGVKTVAVVVIDKNGVRVEGIRGGLASVVERIAEKAPEFVGQMMSSKKEHKEEPKQG
jgi:uncharacterized spore protein YtfJ